MTFQHKPNTGSLFKNDKRETETDRHAQGTALVGGVEYWVSAWTNTKDGGEKWQNLKFSQKDENKAANPAKQEAEPQEDFDDEIPF